MKQRLTELRVEIDNSTIIIRDFNAVLSLLDGTTKEKINKKREDQTRVRGGNLRKQAAIFFNILQKQQKGELCQTRKVTLNYFYCRN